MATTWGSIVGGYGKIGITTSVSSTATTTKVTLAVYFKSRYSLYDSNNKYYYNGNLIGSRNISHYSNTEWSSSNKTKLGDTSYTYTRGTSNVTKTYTAKLSGIERVGGTMSVTHKITVPALAKYTVSYNANGGSGAPGSQTKYYGKSITITSSKPTRTHYTFAGWATSSSGSVAYKPGSTYSSNSSVTLYAKWTPVTYSVSYNANGGSGAPGKQTYSYGGSNITLSTTRPTRQNYNFLGWSLTSTDTSADYQPGQSWSSTKANNYTLYAVWELAYVKPSVSSIKAVRCGSNGNPDDTGSYAKVSFKWTLSQLKGSNPIKTIMVNGNNVQASGTSGSTSIVVGTFSTESKHQIPIVVTDSKGGSTTAYAILNPTNFIIDFKKGGGVAFGKPATKTNTIDTSWPVSTDVDRGSSWYDGRDKAFIKCVNPSNNGSLHSLASLKTENGSWEIGTVRDKLWFSYITDADYNSGTNSQTIGISSDNLVDSIDLSRNVETGLITIDPVANSPTKVHVVFKYKNFTKKPRVVVTASSTVPGTVKEVTVYNNSVNGFDIYINRSNANATSVYWIAIAGR